MAGGTNYSAVVGPRGTIYSAAHGLGGPYAAAMDGPGVSASCTFMFTLTLKQ